MTVPLKIKSALTRNYPQNKDKNYGVEATAWASDVTAALNATPTTNSTFQVDFILGSAAQVTAGTATHSSLAAILAAASDGDVVFVLAGTYQYAAILDITKRLTIINQSADCLHESTAGIAAGAILKFSADRSSFIGGRVYGTAGTPEYCIEVDAEQVEVNTQTGGWTVDEILFTSGLATFTGAVRDPSEGIIYGTPNGGAVVALSNLAGVAINTSLISDTNLTDNLGSAPIEWSTVYAQKVSHGDAGTPDLDIETTSDNGDIKITPHGTGEIILDGTIEIESGVIDEITNDLNINATAAGKDVKITANTDVDITATGGKVNILKLDSSATSTDTITAHAGGGQAAATVLTTHVNRVSVCATDGDSVVLPAAFSEGYEITIINDGAASCDVFPASGDYINNLAVDTAFRLQNNNRLTLQATTTNSRWRIKSLYGNPTWLGITAFAGGGQANATVLQTGLSIITTCATALDSVKLPAVFDLGSAVTVVNNGAKVLNIYPASGDDLGSGADTPIPLIPKNTLSFIPTAANATWITVQDGWQESDEQDVPVTGANWTTIVSKGQFIYKSGVWKLKDNKGIGSISVATNAVTLTWTGLVFKNTANFFQYIGGNPPNAAGAGTPYAITGYTIPNTATANMYAPINVSQISLDADSLTLESMPANTTGGIF